MLKEKIETDFITSLKAKKEIEISVLRMLRAEFLNREKEKRYSLSKTEPDLSEQELEKESLLKDQEILEIIFSRIKRGKESVAGFEKGNRRELAEKERKEINVLKRYLPEQLSEQEVEKVAKEVIKKIGAGDVKDMGKVMAELMTKLKGKTDGALVSKVVKNLLSL